MSGAKARVGLYSAEYGDALQMTFDSPFLPSLSSLHPINSTEMGRKLDAPLPCLLHTAAADLVRKRCELMLRVWMKVGPPRVVAFPPVPAPPMLGALGSPSPMPPGPVLLPLARPTLTPNPSPRMLCLRWTGDATRAPASELRPELLGLRLTFSFSFPHSSRSRPSPRPLRPSSLP